MPPNKEWKARDYVGMENFQSMIICDEMSLAEA